MADELLGKAVLELVADNTKLKKAVEDAKHQASGLQEHFNFVADSIKTAFAGVGVAYVAKQFLDASMEAERAQVMLSSAVRATGMAAGFTAEQLILQSEALQEATGISDESIQQMQTRLLSFRNIHGEVFQRAQKLILDFAAATGTDAASAAQTFGMALNNPIEGMNRLTRAGISLSEQTKDQVKRFVEMGETVKAQNLLMAEAEKSYGGAAAAARDTLGGALNALKGNFENLVLEQQNIIFYLKQMVNWLNRILPEAVAVSRGAFAALVLQMKELAGGPIMMAKNWLQGKSAIGEFVSAHDKAIKEMSAAQDRVKAAMSAKAAKGAPAPGGGAAPGGLGTGLGAEMDQMSRLADELEMRQAALEASARQTATVIEQIWGMSFQTMHGYAGAFINALSTGFQQLFSNISRGTADLGQVMQTIWTTLRDGIFRVLADIMARHAVMFALEATGMQATTAARLTGIQLVQASNDAANAKQIAGSLAVAKKEIAAAAATGSAKAMAAPAGIPFAGIAIGIAAGAAIFASIMALMGKLAEGGPAYSGRPYMVGERGPELFIPSVSGHVVPNNELGRGSGVTISQTFQVTGQDFGDSYSIRRMMSSMAAEMKAASIEALNLARSSGDLNLANARRAV